MADDASIEQDIEIGAKPGGNDRAPSPGQTYQVKAAGDTEYVAGRPLDYYLSMPRALDWAIDDVSRDFGRDIYDRMMLDPQCASVIGVVKTSVIETGLNFQPRITDKDEDGYKDSADLVDEIERMVDDVESDLDDVLWNQLDALYDGYKMAEQVYNLDTTPSGKRQYDLQQLNVKPRESTLFVVDPFQHVKGILAAIPGNNFGLAMQGAIITNPSNMLNLLPAAKFAIYTFRPKDNDPRGSSILRPAFSAWQQKQELMREWVRYLSTFGSPSLIGFTPENAQPYAVMGADGEPVIDPVTKKPMLRNPEQDMVAALEDFANGTVSAFPYGAIVQPLLAQGNGEAFVNAYHMWDMQIAKAVTNQTLATEQSDHQTRASSGGHKDLLDTLTLLCKRPLEKMWRRQILATWLRLNGREKLIPLLPRVTLGSVEREDQSRLWGALGALFASGYIHPSQLSATDEMTGLPKRNPPDESGLHILEQIQVKEDGTTVDTPTDAPPKAGNPGQISGATKSPPGTAPGGGGLGKNVKNPSAPPNRQAGAGDLSPHGGGRGGTGA